MKPVSTSTTTTLPTPPKKKRFEDRSRSPRSSASPWSSTRGPHRSRRSKSCARSRPRTFTFKKAIAVQEAAVKQPLDALLIETDAPYLAPIPRRGKRNEPAYIAYTAARIAELRGLDPEALAQATYENALRIFGIQE
ncbi:MAG: TatD family hydrolase [Deltaproteobacteria bacterium]|nr:TatD family hydrolase [Deltaproteobacteria bacterium]